MFMAGVATLTERRPRQIGRRESGNFTKQNYCSELDGK